MEVISQKKRKRKTPQEKSLNRAFVVVADVIESIANGIRNDIENGKKCEVKQIKELTGAAKELSSLLLTLNSDTGTTADNEKHVTIVFESEGEQWGK